MNTEKQMSKVICAVCICVIILFTAGEPDLLDSIIKWVDRQ